MLKNIRLFWAKICGHPSLGELDAIYKRAISKLPRNTQKEYCERLLNRTALDLKQAHCKYDIEHLKRLSRAAELELYRLDNGIGS